MVFGLVKVSRYLHRHFLEVDVLLGQTQASLGRFWAVVSVGQNFFFIRKTWVQRQRRSQFPAPVGELDAKVGQVGYGHHIICESEINPDGLLSLIA